MIYLSDEDASPPWKRDSLIDVNSMSSSLEQLSTPPSTPYQNNLVSINKKECREENTDVWFINESDQCEIQEGVKLRDGKPRDGKTSIASLYQQGLTPLLPLRPSTYLCQILVNNPLMRFTNYQIH